MTGSFREEQARRVATWSLLMVAASALAIALGAVVGTFLQVVVFDLEEQELLSAAGAWGYVAGLCLVAMMAAPAVHGIVLGERGRRLGEPGLGTTGIVLNALIAAYVVLTGIGTLMFA